MKRVPLGEHTIRVLTHSPMDTGSAEFTYIDLSSVDNRAKRIITPSVLATVDAPSRARQIVAPGDVLVSTVRPNLNAVAAVPEELDGATASTGFTVLRPRDQQLDGRYVFHWVRSSQFVGDMVRKATGASYPAVSDRIVKQSLIPLPKLHEQRRIADILDKTEAVCVMRRQAVARLDELGQSIFHEMFGAVDYPKYRLDEIADVVSGITKGRKVPIGAALSETPYMAVSNVQDMSLNMEVVKTIEVTEAEIIRFSLEKDDLLMTEGGDPDKLGRGTLWTGEIEPCLHQNHIYRVRVRPGAQALPMYLNWATATGSTKDYFLRCAKQTTGIASINKTQLSATPISLPPLALQQQFAKRIAAIGRLKATYKAQLSELDNLFLSLQDRAFKGEL